MARENRIHNQRIYRELKRKIAIEASDNQENGELNQNYNVHLVCEDAFLKAYNNEWRSKMPYVHLFEGANLEAITMHDIKERFNVILYRLMAHEDLNSENILFWIVRTDIHEGVRNNFDYLVSLRNDPEQFYVKNKETDSPEPYGIEQSLELLNVISTGYLMPSKEN